MLHLPLSDYFIVVHMSVLYLFCWMGDSINSQSNQRRSQGSLVAMVPQDFAKSSLDP